MPAEAWWTGFATFDQRISPRAVRGASDADLAVI